jgi:hypothetical protein
MRLVYFQSKTQLSIEEVTVATGLSAANWFELFTKQFMEHLERNSFKELPHLLAHFTLITICLLFGICLTLNFGFLISSRKRPLVDLHVELIDKVYDWNSRVSAKEKYCLSLQHTLRKTLILS